MKIDDSKILTLRAKVRAAHEKFDTAQACHEAWKPAAYDEALHERIGRSFAANTFIVLRQALRREMLLALMRLWDNNSQAVGMKSIANSLQDKRIMDALAAECEAHWASLILPVSGWRAFRRTNGFYWLRMPDVLRPSSGVSKATPCDSAQRKRSRSSTPTPTVDLGIPRAKS